MDILPALYEEVVIPPAVEDELRSPDGPDPTRRWIEAAPTWLRVEKTPAETPEGLGRETAEKLQALNRGERQAIHLATATGAGLLIIDEREGRKIANELGLRITGTLGVLDEAASGDLVDAQRVADRLRETSFRASPELYQWLVDRHS